ncbi:MAG TPA: BamA/TamA family outer membrane protein [Polyangiaceae bacterium]
MGRRSLPFFLVAIFVARAALAADPPADPRRVVEEKALIEGDYVTKRYEPAGFPIVGGDSDIGFQFGVAGTLSRFGEGVVPYEWNMDLIATASVKGVPHGVEIAQQAYLWNIDIPGLAGGKLRLNPFAQFRRTVNQGYFGLGNASSAARPAGADNRYFEYIHEETGARLVTRYELAAPLYLLSSTAGRYVDPTPYAGSRLATDASSVAPNGSPSVVGVHALAVVSEGAGVLYDSRDSEIFTRAGWLGHVGVAFDQGFPLGAGVTFGEADVSVARYLRVGGPFVLAAHATADFKFGHVPFFELFTGGVFNPDYMIGGSASIRGVPFGRYLGQIKAVGNVELRALHARFHVLGQTMQLGNDVFFDTGRVWSDYTFRSPLDGSGVGLKWGTGLGGYLLWGQAAMFRIDVAYSPDAVSENPGFPVGIYIEDGLSF